MNLVILELPKKWVSKMEGPDDEIRRMNLEQTMSLVRTRDLLPLANQLVWERLVQLGLYDGNPNPAVSREYRYTRSEILLMKRDTDRFVEVLGLLPQVKQMVINSQKTQFSDLPPEVMVNILGRVSPTAREGTLVSRGMKELADVALMDNIRSGNLIDPTIGIPGRGDFFKVDVWGNADYFSPEPGLWQAVRKYRSERLGDLRYDSFANFIGRRSPEYAVNFVPLILYGTIHDEQSFRMKQKFVSLAMIDFNSNSINHRSKTEYKIYSVSGYKEFSDDNYFSISGNTYSYPDVYNQVINYFTRGIKGDKISAPEFKLDMQFGNRIAPGPAKPVYRGLNFDIQLEVARCEILRLTNELVYSGQLIFPSIRDDVILL